MTVEELPAYLVEHWEELRAQLLAGTYQPRPVKRQLIPKVTVVAPHVLPLFGPFNPQVLLASAGVM